MTKSGCPSGCDRVPRTGTRTPLTADRSKNVAGLWWQRPLAAQLRGSRAGSWLTSHPGLPDTVPVLAPRAPRAGRALSPRTAHAGCSRELAQNPIPL